MKSRQTHKVVSIASLESRLLFAAAKQVMGFLTDYEIGNGNSIFSENGSSTTDTLDWNGLSQVDYFSVLPAVTTVANSSTLYCNGSIQALTDSGYNYSSQIPALVHDADLHNAAVFLVAGGGDSAAISDMNALLSSNTSDSERATFADNLAQTCETFGMTGVDFDWEPSNAGSTEVTNFGNLIADIRGHGLNVSADGLPQYDDIGDSDTGTGSILPFSSTALADLTSINIEEYTNGSFTYPDTNEQMEDWATAVGSAYVAKLQFGLGTYNTEATTTVNSAVSTTLSQGYGGLFVWTLADPATASEVSEIATDLSNGGSSVALGFAASYYLRLDPDGKHVDFYDNSTGAGSVYQQLVPSQVNALFTAGGAGSITIDNSAGNVLSSAGVSLTGDGSTALTIVGSGAGDTVTQNSGQILYNAIPIRFNDITQTTLNPNGGTDALTVNAGKLDITAAPAGGGILARSFSSINIGAGAELQVLTPAAHSDRALLVVGALSIAGSAGDWTGTLDLGGNDMDLQTGNLATITSMAAAGYDLAGTARGLTSSVASSDTTHLTILGVIQNNQGGSPIFGSGAGQSLFDKTSPGAADILVKYTYFGDANLDGKVDASDYSRIDNGYLNHLTGWFNGDFNYDGVINGSDYTLIDNAFNSQRATLAAVSAPPTATALTQVVVQAVPPWPPSAQTSAQWQSDSSYPGGLQGSMPIAFLSPFDDGIDSSLRKKDILDAFVAPSI